MGLLVLLVAISMVAAQNVRYFAPVQSVAPCSTYLKAERVSVPGGVRDYCVGVNRPVIPNFEPTELWALSFTTDTYAEDHVVIGILPYMKYGANTASVFTDGFLPPFPSETADTCKSMFTFGYYTKTTESPPYCGSAFNFAVTSTDIGTPLAGFSCTGINNPAEANVTLARAPVNNMLIGMLSLSGANPSVTVGAAPERLQIESNINFEGQQIIFLFNNLCIGSGCPATTLDCSTAAATTAPVEATTVVTTTVPVQATTTVPVATTVPEATTTVQQTTTQQTTTVQQATTQQTTTVWQTSSSQAATSTVQQTTTVATTVPVVATTAAAATTVPVATTVPSTTTVVPTTPPVVSGPCTSNLCDARTVSFGIGYFNLTDYAEYPAWLVGVAGEVFGTDMITFVPPVVAGVACDASGRKFTCRFAQWSPRQVFKFQFQTRGEGRIVIGVGACDPVSYPLYANGSGVPPA